MADPNAPYRSAHEDTSDALHRVESLATALYDLAFSHTSLSSNDPTSQGIVSLIVVIQEKAKLAQEFHSVEWDLIVKPAAALSEPAKL